MNHSMVDITISVVSHGQASLINDLLHDIDLHCHVISIELILTLNLEESLPFALDSFSFPIKLISNITPKGFGANHNQAFSYATGAYFCVLNPDVRFNTDPFPALLANLKEQSIGVVAPLVLSEHGAIENSARKFPTPFKILCKALGRCKHSDYVITDQVIQPDWVGGMFMLLPSKIFAQVAGFDERYFLYYEDVDFCARLRLLGYDIVLCPQAKVFHYAQRDSHDSFKYFVWHVSSMLRFFVSPVFWRVQFKKYL